jgi:hypothetical protein
VDCAGTEVLRVATAEGVHELDDWIHDAYLEDALEFDADARRAMIPFAQESGWGARDAGMADPVLRGRGLLWRRYEVPLTRCRLVVENATALDAEVDWHSAMLTGAAYVDGKVRLGLLHGAVAVAVAAVDVRVMVTGDRAGALRRRVWRGWPVESDHRID